MLNADQVNHIIESALSTIETRIPMSKQLAIGNPEAVKTSGAYGSVILGALFTGSAEGKLTVTMEWGTGFQVAEALAGVKIEGYNETAQQALEKLFQEILQTVANRFAEVGMQLDIRVLPTLVDTSVLLGEDGRPGAIKIPILMDSGAMNLFLAF